MSALDKIRQKAMQEGMKLMSDPRFAKIMSNPKAQKAMMLAFQLPTKIEGAFAKQGKAFARRFKLATREDVEKMRGTIRDLEQQLARVRNQLGDSK